MIGSGRVLDTSALVDLVTKRSRYTEAAVWTVTNRLGVLVIPSLALTVARVVAPEPDKAFQEVVDLPITIVDELTAAAASRLAVLLTGQTGRSGRSGLSAGDLAAAQAVDSARRRGFPVVTGEPDAVRRLDPGVDVELIP